MSQQLTKVTVTIIIVCVALVSVDAYSQNLLTNGGFDFDAMDGLALEWSLDGIGTPECTDGVQRINNVHAGAQASLFQVVPLCDPGAAYRFSVEIADIAGDGAVAWVGLAPSLEAEDEEIAWESRTDRGPFLIETAASGTNLVVYLSVTNFEGSTPVHVAFDNARLTALSDATTPSKEMGGKLPRIKPVHTEKSAESPVSAEYAAGMHYLDRRVPQLAGQMFTRVVTDLPGNRADAAMALVRLQEVAHYDMYTADLLPLRQREQVLATGNLRQVLIDYPEQTEACAFALCKLGDYYNDRIDPELGRTYYERTMAEYDGTEGAAWSRKGMIDYFRAKDEIRAASPYFHAIESAYENGNLDPRLMAWAEACYSAHLIDGQERVDFWQDLFLKYKDTAPEPAARFKRNHIYGMARSATRQTIINELKEFLDELGYIHPLTDGYRVELAEIYADYGGSADYHSEAIALCNQVLNAEDAHGNHIQQAERLLAELAAKSPPYRPKARGVLPKGEDPVKYDVNLLMRQDFGGIGKPPFARWDSYGAPPNWPLCNWSENDGRPLKAAWNTVNCGGGSTYLDGGLLQREIVVDASTAFHARVKVAGEGFMGGDLSETSCELTVQFHDGFQNLLREDATGQVSLAGTNREWLELSVASTTPEDAVYAGFRVHFTSGGPDHRAIAFRDPEFVLLSKKEGK